MLLRRKHKASSRKDEADTVPFLVDDRPPAQYQQQPQQAVEVEWNGYSYDRPRQKQSRQSAYNTRFRAELSALKQRLELVKRRKRERQQCEIRCTEEGGVEAVPPQYLQQIDQEHEQQQLQQSTSSQSQSPTVALQAMDVYGPAGTNADGDVDSLRASQHHKPHEDEDASVIPPPTASPKRRQLLLMRRKHEQFLEQRNSLMPQIPVSLLKRKQNYDLKQQHHVSSIVRQQSSESSNSIKSTVVHQAAEDDADLPHNDYFDEPKSAHHISAEEKHALEQERMSRFLYKPAEEAPPKQKTGPCMPSAYYKTTDETAESTTSGGGCFSTGARKQSNTSVSSWSMWLPDLSHSFGGSNSSNTSQAPAQTKASASDGITTKLMPRVATPPSSLSLSPSRGIAVPEHNLPPPSATVMTRVPTPPKRNVAAVQQMYSSSSPLRNSNLVASPTSSISSKASTIHATPNAVQSNSNRLVTPPASPSRHQVIHSPQKSESTPNTSYTCASSVNDSTFTKSTSATPHTDREYDHDKPHHGHRQQRSPRQSKKYNPHYQHEQRGRYGGGNDDDDEANNEGQGRRSHRKSKRFSIRNLLQRSSKSKSTTAHTKTTVHVTGTEYSGSGSAYNNKSSRRRSSVDDTWRIQPKVDFSTDHDDNEGPATATVHHMEMIWYENHSDHFYDGTVADAASGGEKKQ
mmetsp:Transcript_20627/g.58692  ORF Transcript_20627/g.58692 Transcript_20627/m.58692 type:complete len:687 (+) Transcript_20627:84-2144(+)|eukprot:CAMPEP_0119552372 /NCGR_PEP_ID=MMETSP1352-20130426/5393_1 /TAXON_ID=265584 /ORGANISM="Stauroneis constricta, Strain CCMP1120" /LENGTH=686 /DNA_ID=CAMNT_0007598605 /DNA_START=83 /DNA_END=2143 /DNA_ORIENTATION=+